MKRSALGWITLALVALFSIATAACTMTFSYESIQAPLGTVGEIGIHVQKTHNNCTLPSMDDYLIDGSGVQIVGETAWEDLGSGLYEKWVQVSLSEIGDGFLKISKDCIKEGYDEEVLPISILPVDAKDSLWSMAWSGTYPFDEPSNVNSVVGSASFEEDSLIVDGVRASVTDVSELPESLPESVRLYTTDLNGDTVAVLLVGDGIFLRFDHLI